MRVYSDNAQTSKRGKNKEVSYEPQASSVADFLTTFWRPLWSCMRYQSTHAPLNGIYFIHCFDTAFIPHKFRNVLNDLRSDDLRAQIFAAHYVIRASWPGCSKQG